MHLHKLFSVILFAFALFVDGTVFAADFSAQWKEVEAAQEKGLPQTALTALEPIITGALAAQDYNAALQAIVTKAQLTGEIEGRDAAAGIRVLAPYLETAPPEFQPMLAAALARFWQNYYEGNRWQLLQRSRTSGADDTDFLTWDATRVLAERDRLYTLALSDPAALQRTPVTAFSKVLVRGDADLPDAYRPTLYDFLIHDAIAFYSLGEQGVAQSEDHFEPAPDSPLLGSLEEFLAWKPQTTDTASPTLKAIRLFQDVLRFHQNDTLALALSDADLQRILWARKTLAEADGTDARYEQTLRAFIERWKNYETASAAAAELALFLRQESNQPVRPLARRPGGVVTGSAAGASNPLEAYKTATLGIALHPDSPGAKRCRAIVAHLEARELQGLQTESVWNAPWPDIAITYKNLEQLHFRAVPADWNDFLQRHRNRPGSLNDEEFAALLKQAVAKNWAVSLPKTNYGTVTHSVAAPVDLKPGFYFIIASVDESFSNKKNAVGYFPVWVSDLALLYGQDAAGKPNQDDNIQGYVLRADTGEPVPGATVTAWHRDRAGERVKISPVKTDATGAFSLKSPSPNNVLLLAESPDGHRISNEDGGYFGTARDNTVERTRPYIHFLTDRAIYRPGQTIQFKAVVYSANRDTNKYEVLAGRKVTVAISDPNGKEAGKLELYTNGFGSVSGSFVVPAGRLNGQYALHTVGPENGRGYVSIEEYKRPKFEVKLDAPAVAAKLNDTVTLNGTAAAYTGAPVDGAQVKWSVRRTVRWPRWCWWFPSGSERAIAHGSAVTDGTGKFSISFTAAPDASADPKNEPKFDYRVVAEITDGTGETRDAARTITVGHTALEADLSADDWQTTDRPVSLKIATTTLDGVPQKATGTVMIYSLKQPERVLRPALSNYRPYGRSPDGEADAADPRNWAEDIGVATERFTTDDKGAATLETKLPAGIYRAVLTTQDRFGKPVSARAEIRVNDPAAARAAVRVPFDFTPAKNDLQPGDTFTALWSTGYDTGRALVSIEHRGKVLQRFWTDAARTQQQITLPVTEELRGGFNLRVLQVRENRLHTAQHAVRVPWKNKELKLGWERFNSKLVPGGSETWTLRIQNPDATGAAAEIAAALYDASLDQFRPHGWGNLQGAFYSDTANYWWNRMEFANQLQASRQKMDSLNDTADWNYQVSGSYRHWSWNWGFNRVASFGAPRRMTAVMGMAAAAPMADGAQPSSMMKAVSALEAAPMETLGVRQEMAGENGTGAGAPPNLDAVTARKNLQETAFFFPSMVAEKDGTVHIAFSVPEALTRWNFLGFAHDKELRSGIITDTAVTAKDLMVQPNPPRFVREGDIVEITVKLTNKTDSAQSGKVRLTFADALTLDPADTRLGNGTPERAFTLAANSSQSLSWRVHVPDGQGFLIYKAVGAAGLVSDGEEGFLPVLSRRQLVTESVPLPVRGAVTRKFRFEKLLASGNDTSLRHESLNVQMVSNPAWYAVMALPYLMEYQHECSEQIFSRLYANALARHIAGSDPKIARIFEQWKNTPALDSPLFKNEDIKSVLIAETPWVRAAEAESAQRRNVGVLFDKNRTDAEIAGVLRRLAERQFPDGRWSWFPDGPASDYITRHIVAGFGKLRHLGVEIDTAVAVRALPSLDTWLTGRLEEIKKSAEKRGVDYRRENHLSALIAFHLYMRSFFLETTPIAETDREAYDYFLEQGRSHWLEQPRQSQGHLALALHRFKDSETPAAILRSLKEHAKHDGELGMYWAGNDTGWFWWQAPIETHALLIEAFDEVESDTAVVDDLQTWLLKQKQTQAWPSTKSTADAVYALLLRGTDKLASDSLVTVSLAGKTVQPKNVEPGTGFYAERFAGAAVKPEMGEIAVAKTDTGVAWGSVTWQYFQDVDKITPHDGTPLKLKKTLWKKVLTKNGEELVPVPQNQIKVGDTLVVRVELRVDRDMEFVHLKDQRGSGTEPVNVLSGYRWRDGLGHYESTGDTATHFFIDWLRQGTHVFEYPVRVQLRGVYQSGIAEIQCMYAPEFNSHSESVRLVVE